MAEEIKKLTQLGISLLDSSASQATYEQFQASAKKSGALTRLLEDGIEVQFPETIEKFREQIKQDILAENPEI